MAVTDQTDGRRYDGDAYDHAGGIANRIDRGQPVLPVDAPPPNVSRRAVYQNAVALLRATGWAEHHDGVQWIAPTGDVCSGWLAAIDQLMAGAGSARATA